MIDWLEIKQFAITEHVELEFDKNFTAVTGETGSGKSLIVDAINILLGHRSDSSYIRHNHDVAEIQASFEISSGHPAFSWLDQHGMGMEDECILRRVLRRDKPSKGYINGHAATVSQLKDLGKELVDIHGQNEHHSLLKKPTQLRLLDSAANNSGLMSELGQCYDSLSETKKRIDQLHDQNHLNQERADMLKFQIEELIELAPEADEWNKLDASLKRLNHQQELSSGVKQVADGLYESENGGICKTLMDYSQQIDQLSAFDTELKPIRQMIDEAQVNLQEATNQLRPFYQDTDINPEELESIESRFSRYHFLARKHRIQPDELYNHMESMQKELHGLQDPESELARLEDSYALEFDRYKKIAQKISAARHTSSKRLIKDVTEIMQELGMRGGKLDIKFTDIEHGSFTRYGNESIEFLVSANAGHPLQPLNKVASGGELSRISLAIQVILANKAQVNTLIFDEVDVGIGGEVANTVGQKLKTLGESTQVICVTHLSQVAAKGDHHFSVKKQGESEVGSVVTKLDPSQRVEEIARMTGGENLTEQSLAHAQEMLKSA